MKKIIAMAAMLSAVVVFAYTYRLQTLAWLQLPAFAVTEKDISDTLKNDEDPGEDKEVLSLRSCTEDETLYRRANRYYIGDNKDSVDITYPLFAQEGTALYYLSGDFKLVTSDFDAYEPYEGMLLSNGTAYETDGQVAEDEEYILSTAGKGLYINAQPMTLYSSGRETNIRLNSIMYLGDAEIHYYSYEDGHLVYGQTRVNYGDTVSIGSVSMTYDEFLKQLGLVAEYSATGRKEPETQETEANIQDNSRENRKNSSSSGDHANGETVADGESTAAAEVSVTVAVVRTNPLRMRQGNIWIQTIMDQETVIPTMIPVQMIRTIAEAGAISAPETGMETPEEAVLHQEAAAAPAAPDPAEEVRPAPATPAETVTETEAETTAPAEAEAERTVETETTPEPETTARIPVMVHPPVVIPTSGMTNTRFQRQFSPTLRQAYTA